MDTSLPVFSGSPFCCRTSIYIKRFIHQELAVMKQVLISMQSRQGEAGNLLETNKTRIMTSSTGRQQSKRITRITEEESPNKPKPTVFVSF